MLNKSGDTGPERARRPEDAETALVARIVDGDVRAFEELYRIYHPRLSRFLMGMIRRPSLVDDVLSETMMIVWTDAARFDGSSRLSSWIFGIAYRKALKGMRREDLPVEDSGAEARVAPGPDPEQQEGGRRSAVALRDALRHLSADHQAVVELTYFQEFGYREIARIMDCPVDTVKTRMFHARRHLARLLPGASQDWL